MHIYIYVLCLCVYVYVYVYIYIYTIFSTFVLMLRASPSTRGGRPPSSSSAYIRFT